MEMEFSDYQNPVRAQFIELMSNCKLSNDEFVFHQQLKNKEYHPKGIAEVRKIVQAVYKLAENGHHEIIANTSCKIPPRPLMREIKENWSESMTQHRHHLQMRLKAINVTLDTKYSEEEQKKEDHITAMMHGLKIENDKLHVKIAEEQENIEKAIFKQDKYFRDRLKQIKQSKQYQLMKDKGSELTNLEILAVLLYCDLDEFCNKMKKSQRDMMDSCKWKTLFKYICSAIDKMHKVFYFQNNRFLKTGRNKCEYLLHGNKIPNLGYDQESRLALNTVTSFTRSYSVMMDFAKRDKQDLCKEPDGMILIIKDACKLLYDGTLKGASVAWLSSHVGEDEFIILPTTFYDFKLLGGDERKKNGWPIPSQYSMYVASGCESNNCNYAVNDPLDVNSDPLIRILQSEHLHGDLYDILRDVVIDGNEKASEGMKNGIGSFIKELLHDQDELQQKIKRLGVKNAELWKENEAWRDAFEEATLKSNDIFDCMKTMNKEIGELDREAIKKYHTN